ncbi:MAG: DNA replication protein [Rhodospirillaceae bacterium]|jgi:chromosomal replication initiation ATPase DnaA|nr:DNA replication protein [Rhodospirillaceae bacterium]
MHESSQLSFDFGSHTRFTDIDFLVAKNNIMAHNLILRWPMWSEFALCLCGPAGCGKSHLANIHCKRSNGILLSANELYIDEIPRLINYQSIIVEDVDKGVDEVALFHLFNLLNETDRFLLLTGACVPVRWNIDLPDLRSRLLTISTVTINHPDDDLLAALLIKLFADRQLYIDVDVLKFILTHMERSFDVARRFVATIDSLSLNQRRGISISLARIVIDSLVESPTNNTT